ncbi:MAG: hypothetical protein PF590_10940 [Candidatus Delongbacteria bacterium]|jgi:hypothetical protein|nr:hypothetical protein [Candidatus Delongbacteria bacterium]
MKISGFTMVKNATKLYYPIRQSIESILPIVEEFVVALGDCDEDDNTEEEIASIGSDKIKIIHTEWDIEKYPKGTENAHQTDIARSHCTGDWLFYLQADEVVHEKYLPVIQKRCEELLHDKKVEGLVFDYVHFWGDYYHHQISHVWYPREIRIIRNDPDIHSWESAQSFRRIPGFDGKNYRQQEGTYRLKCALAHADIFHYGWVRPPMLMQSKKKSLATIHHGKSQVQEKYKKRADFFYYGPLGRTEKFKGTHPNVMMDWIEKFDWANELNYSSKEINPQREKNKHDRIKYRIVSFIEKHLLGGKRLGQFKNYILLKSK